MTPTFFYRFDTEAEALSAFDGLTIDGRFEMETVFVDVIGTIFKETGVTIHDPEFGDYPEYAPLPWFHLNAIARIEEIEAFEIFPVTPYRVFA